jgi:ferredoxin
MAYVITGLCVDCKYTSCAAVCPVEAFHETPDRLYINADTCIDCDLCVPECPVEAIFQDSDVPDEYEEWIELNETEAENFPIINEEKEPLKGPKCVDPNAA